MRVETIGDCTLYCGDSLAVLPTLADNSVDLILTDPPYYKVKAEPWDRQWDTPAGFLAWLDKVLEQFARILKPNGSLYLFASPKMAARVEVLIAGRFNVLNRIRWVKNEGWHNKAEKEALRSYLSPWEEVIFAEHYGADSYAKGEAGYAAKCDELRGFIFEPLRAYLRSEFDRAGVHTERANEFCGTASMAGRHYFTRSQWCLPTEEHYHQMREGLKRADHGGDYLRREYEDLRREYEDLRRPFSVTADVPYTDVWTFPTVQAYPGKHPCEKPAPMLEHIITASSRPGAVVLDAFMGSGSTGIAARKLGRKFIGIELSEHWHAQAGKRIAAAYAQPRLEAVHS